MYRETMTLMTACSMLALTACASTTPRQPRVPSPDRAQMQVMTYNVNYGLAGDPETLAVIEQASADVIFLQETTPAWEQILRRTLAGRYPHMAFRHCCGAGGLAVLSKHPFASRQYRHAATEGSWFPGWRVVVQGPLGPVQVLQVHLRPQLSDGGSVVSGVFTTPPIRRAEITDYRRWLDPELPALVVGDFNEGDDGQALGVLVEGGLQTVLPEFRPEADTWRWTTSVGTVKTRLDHIVYDPARLDPLDARVIQAGRSDHLPVVAIFELRE